MRLLVFEKINRYIWVSVFNRLDPKNDKPVKKKKPILKSSPAKSTPKQRQTHVQKLEIRLSVIALVMDGADWANLSED